MVTKHRLLVFGGNMDKPYFYNGHYGYYVKGFGLWGWGNMGPIVNFCRSKKDAEELAEEYRIEDDAKIYSIKEAKKFVHLPDEQKYINSLEKKKIKTEPILRGFVEYWDGTKRCLRGTEEQFYSLDEGVRIVFWNEFKDKIIIKTDYDFIHLWSLL